MAGSYGHLRPIKRDDDHDIGGWSLIENMGDAYEAVEELLWLTLYFARTAHGLGTLKQVDARIQAALDDEFYPMAQGLKPKDEAFRAVENVMSDVHPMELDEIAVRRATRRTFEAAERAAEEKIRAIVRDEITKLARD